MFEGIFSYLLQSYKNKSSGEARRARILVTILLLTVALGLLIVPAMAFTGATVVSFMIVGGLVMCTVAVYLIRNGSYKPACNFLIVLLCLVLFAAIKFDQYVSDYEAYVYSTFGLFIILITCLIGYSHAQIVAVTVFNVAEIYAVFFLDVLPTMDGAIPAHTIQTLAATTIFSIMGGIVGYVIMSLTKDLIGESEAAARSIASNLKNLESAVGSQQRKQLAAAKKLSLSSTRTQDLIEGMESDLSHIERDMRDLHAAMGETIEVNASISTAADAARGSLAAYNEAVNATTSSMDTIIVSLQATSEQAASGKENVDNLLRTAMSGGDRLIKLEQAVEKITRSITSMMEVSKIITGVASKTNLLALNASIEAAHAGAHGKGFGVVADEIYQLAEETSRNAANISNNLKENMGAMSSVLGISADVRAGFDTMMTDTDKVSAMIESLTAAISGLAQRAGEVKESVGGLGEVSARVDSAFDSVKGSISRSSASLDAVVVESKSVLDRTGSIMVCFENILDESQKVASVGRVNVNEIARFKARLLKIASSGS